MEDCSGGSVGGVGKVLGRCNGLMEGKRLSMDVEHGHCIGSLDDESGLSQALSFL